MKKQKYGIIYMIRNKINNKIYFGELTLYPQNGFDNTLLETTEILWGQKIELSKINNENN